jgi:hypothetical protein
VQETLVNIVDEAKRADTELLEEPSAKRVKRDVVTVRLADIASFWRDQVKNDIGDASDDVVLGFDDMRKMTAPQIVTAMMEAFGPDRWKARLARLGSRFFFRVLALAPDKSGLMAWGDEPSDNVVTGLCPVGRTKLETIVRPCFESFVGKPKPSAEQLHELCNWKLLMLRPLIGVLMENGFSYSAAVEALQEEYNVSIMNAPHNGTGVPASRRCCFNSLHQGNEHISQCQVCLELFTLIREDITTKLSGIFAVYSRLFRGMGAEHGYSMCAFILLMMSQSFMGNPEGGSKGPQVALPGPTSIGKSWTMNMIMKALWTELINVHNSGSMLSSLYGDPICNLPDSLVRFFFHFIFNNEFTPTAGTLQNEWWGDDKQQHVTGRKLSDTGERVEPTTTTVVKLNTFAMLTTNSMAGEDGEISPAAAARWIPFYGMNPPANVHRLFQTPETIGLAKCARETLNYLLSMETVQAGGLSDLAPEVRPPFPLLISALEIMRNPGGGAPSLISIRTMESTRYAVLSAWQAHVTLCLLLTVEPVSMLHLLIARSIAVPYDWLPFIMQASGVSPTSEELAPPFGRLGASCLLVHNPETLPRGYTRITDVAADSHRKLQTVLGAACEGLVVRRKSSVENMTLLCSTFPGQSDYCCKTTLLSMQPPREALNAAQSIMHILSEMVEQDLLLVDDNREFVYLPNFFLMWLNGQDVPLVEKLMTETPFDSTIDSTRHHKVHVLTADQLTDAVKKTLKDIAVHLYRLAKYRYKGFIWALLHCGGEYPHLAGTADYKLDKTLTAFILQPAASAAPNQQQPVQQQRNPVDFVPDKDVLKRPDISPKRLLPLRVYIDCMKNLPVGVSILIRTIQQKMRLPNRRITVPLTNDGITVIHPEPANTIKFGDTVNSGLGKCSLELLAHPNSMIFDAVTCFCGLDPSKLLEDVLYYIWTMYAWFCCRLELVDEASDELLILVAPNIKSLTVDWAFDVDKEIEFLSRGEITTTVRMVVLAMLIHGAKATARFPFPANFVAHLIDKTKRESASDLVPTIVSFIAERMEIGGLIRSGRALAEKLVLVPSPHTFLESMLIKFPETVQNALKPSIVKFYDRLHSEQCRQFSSDNFHRFANTRSNIIP